MNPEFRREPPCPGTILPGGLRLLNELRGGGQGSVWLAEDPDGLKRAVKFLHSEDEHEDSVLLLAQAVSNDLSCEPPGPAHPNLTQLLSHGKSDWGLFCAMTLAPGNALDELERPVSEESFIAVMLMTASALAWLHTSRGKSLGVGVGHRDVKPSNIVVEQAGGVWPHVTLVDLGSVGSLGRRLESRYSPKLEYTAPNVIRSSTFTGYDDVFSLGAVAWHMVHGQPPRRLPAGNLPRLEAKDWMAAAWRELPELRLSDSVNDIEPPVWVERYAPLVQRMLNPETPHPNVGYREDARPSALEVAQVIYDLARQAAEEGAIRPVWRQLESLTRSPYAVHEEQLDNARSLQQPDTPPPGALAALLDELREHASDTEADPNIQLALGEVAELAGDRAAAVNAYEQVGDRSELALYRAVQLSELDSEQDSQRWERAAEAGSPAAAARLSELWEADGDLSGAIEAARKATQAGSGKGAFRLWELLIKRAHPDDQEEARLALDRAVDRGYPAACVRSGKQAFADGRISEAERLWLRADQGGNAEASALLGDLHVKRGDPDLALDCFQRAQQRGHPSALGLGKANRALAEKEHEPRKTAELRETALKALQLAAHEGADEAVDECAQMLLDMHRYQEAADFLAGVDTPPRYKLLALAYLASGNPTAARDTLVQARKTRNLEVDEQLLLVAALVRTGDSEAARHELGTIPTSFDATALPLDFAAGVLASPAPPRTASLLYYTAEFRRHQLSNPGENSSHAADLANAYRHAANLGSPDADWWLGYYSADERVDAWSRAANAGITQAKFAIGRLSEGEHGERYLQQAADEGHAEAAIELARRLRDANPDRAIELFRTALRAGHGSVGVELAELLGHKLGYTHRDVAAALSQADLHGDSASADKLGTFLWRIEGDLVQALAAKRRAERRGLEAGALNAGVILESMGRLDEAEAAYRHAIELGDHHARLWLALLLLDREDGQEEAALGEVRPLMADNLAAQELYQCAAIFHRVIGWAGSETLETYRRAADRGMAWAAYQLSCCPAFDAIQQRDWLARARALVEDNRHDLWIYISDRDMLRRLIDKRERELPLIAGPHPHTLRVDPSDPGSYARISDAIAEAAAGDLILVAPGLYNEGLIINKPLTIVGHGQREHIVVTAHGTDSVNFSASIGRVSNLTLRQTGDGDWFAVDIGQGRLELDDCDISSDSLACVAVHGNADPLVRRNRIHDGKQGGVVVWEHGRGTFEDNDIFANELAGIQVKSGGDPTVERNRIHDGKQSGVFVCENGRGTFRTMTFSPTSSPGSKSSRVAIRQCNTTAFTTANRVACSSGRTGAARSRTTTFSPTSSPGSKSSPVAIRPWNATAFTTANRVACSSGRTGAARSRTTTFSPTSSPGSEVKSGGDPTVQRNRIHDGKQGGVFVWEDGRGTFEDNDIFANELAGIEVKSGGDPTVQRNRIHDGKQGGVFVCEDGRGTFEDNDVFANELAGIEVRSGGDPTVRRNRINSNGSKGVWSHQGGRGTFTDNDLRSNERGLGNLAGRL